jgi:hypothetical protein
MKSQHLLLRVVGREFVLRFVFIPQVMLALIRPHRKEAG